jgi:hypothetical protein
LQKCFSIVAGFLVELLKKIAGLDCGDGDKTVAA